MDILEKIKKLQLDFFKNIEKDKEKYHILTISDPTIKIRENRSPYFSTHDIVFSYDPTVTFSFTIRFSDQTCIHAVNLMVSKRRNNKLFMFVSDEKGKFIVEEGKEFWFPFYQLLYLTFGVHCSEMPELRMHKLFDTGPKTYEEIKKEVMFL